MPATEYEADAPHVYETADGRYFAWRLTQVLAHVDDVILLPLPKRSGDPIGPVTLTYLACVDPANPTVTTFAPEIGTTTGFAPDTIDGRSVAASASAPAKSQAALACYVDGEGLYVRPSPSGTCTMHMVAVVREGHRV